MKRIKQIGFIAFLSFVAIACCNRGGEVGLEGRYTYQHAFDYDMAGNHIDVRETGTMDFHADSTVLDSARQIYTVVMVDGDTATIVFNYVSPSRWHLDGDTLYFAGIKERFRMEVLECDDRCSELAQQVIAAYSGGIDYEYRFHLDTLTEDLLRWSFTYRDGHSDTWEFNRE